MSEYAWMMPDGGETDTSQSPDPALYPPYTATQPPYAVIPLEARQSPIIPSLLSADPPRSPSESRISDREESNVIQSPYVPFYPPYDAIQPSYAAIQPSYTATQPPLDASQCMQILVVLQQILTTIQKSTIMKPETTDIFSRFWMRYKVEADEYDKDLLDKYNGDLDIALIFAGLFSAVCATFIVLVQPDLKPDPNDVTHALLQMLILTVNGTAPQSIASAFPAWTGPSQTTVWIQALFIGAMGCSLFAAMVAVLGKRWLVHFSQAGIRGTLEDRGRDRQWKLEGLYKWGFNTVLGAVPLFLQISLFLFGIGMSLYLWDQQRALGIVFTVMTSLAGLLYTLFTLAPLFFPNCPFGTPLTSLLKRAIQLGSFIAQFIFEHVLVLAKFVGGKIAPIRRPPRPTRLAPLRPGTTSREGDRAGSHGGDTEAQRPSHSGGVRGVLTTIAAKAKSPLRRLEHLSSATLIPTDELSLNSKTDTAALLWALDTSDDPATRELAMEYALEVDWPDRVHLFPLLNRLLADYDGCFITSPGDTSGLMLQPSRVESAIACGRAFVFFYWLHHHDDIRSWRLPTFVEGMQGEHCHPTDPHLRLDEFFGVHFSVMATLDGHISRCARSDSGRSARVISWQIPSVHFPPATSPATVATTSFMLSRMLLDPHLRHENTLQLLGQPIIDLGVPGLHAQATPSVKRHFFPAFAMFSKRIQALTRDEGRKLIKSFVFDGSSLMDQLDETTRQLEDAPKGYPNSTILLHNGNVFDLLLVLMSGNWQLRNSCWEAGYADWCLQQCRDLFSLAEDSYLTYGYLLRLLYLALVMMDTNPTSHRKPSAESVEFILSTDDKKALIPHFTWIRASLHFCVSPFRIFDPQNDPAGIFIKDLIARGFSAIGQMFQLDDPSLFRTGSLPNLADILLSYLLSPPPSTPQSDRFDYTAAVSCARSVMESILRHVKQRKFSSPSLSLGDLLSFLLIFGAARDDTCHALFTEITHLLTESLQSSDGARLSVFDVITVIREWSDKHDGMEYRIYDDPTGRAHLAWSTVARIVLQFDWIERCLDLGNLGAALGIALVAWGGDLGYGTPPDPSGSATGHNQTQTCLVKITPQVARGTLSLLSRVPPDIAGEFKDWGKRVSQNRRGDDELDFTGSLSPEDGQQLLERVYAAFDRLTDMPPFQEDMSQSSESSFLSFSDHHPES